MLTLPPNNKEYESSISTISTLSMAWFKIDHESSKEKSKIKNNKPPILTLTLKSTLKKKKEKDTSLDNFIIRGQGCYL
jgi:HD-like signal output (HDOD) protein